MGFFKEWLIAFSCAVLVVIAVVALLIAISFYPGLFFILSTIALLILITWVIKSEFF